MEKQTKVAMITGAASGIGRATAIELAKLGTTLHLVDLNQAKLDELKTQLQSQVEVYCYAGDLTDSSFVQSILNAIDELGAGLDFAFNNAGMTCPAAPIDEMDDHIWDRLMNVNLNSIYHCLKLQIKLMKKIGRGGSIVNTSSMLGLIATKNRAAYVASKHAVTGLTKACALDGAEYQIRVNSIHPGYIETPLIEHLDLEILKAKHPVGRLGTSEEVAHLVCFLLSDQAKFITGSQYVIDGAYSIQ